MSNAGYKAMGFLFIGGLSWYTGLKFWQPIVIEQLKKDHSLRDDVYINEDFDDQPKSWQDLKDKVAQALERPEPPQERQLNSRVALSTSSSQDESSLSK
ncbi:uncharacterized protein KQ657_004571 [Scheffersomyces spartinae]|uniref:Uncharacterized protein n=1 Tax=Scheffersomyces spartinae TaxID=45513 RepID=A0A9P7VAH7_9ASCO|nr:uncharacterized protein KQ657_004571 [Scheffersomyces spartinae]KAG7194359.1 hypothetical protein KQ657_004571 [Scheffersomyces spartinae]